MPEDQVTIDPEFRPPAPAEGQSRRLRAAGVVGVVIAAFAFGWFLRSPVPTEPEPDEGYASAATTTTEEDAQTEAASTTTRPPTTTTTSDPLEVIELEVPLSEAIPGFTDVITMEQWNETGVDVIRWRSSQPSPETVASFGGDDEFWFAGLDTSGGRYALQNEDGVLSVHRVEGVDAWLAWFPDLQAVGVRVSSVAWHDTEPGQLAWLACSRTPGGPGTLFRLDAADGMAEPVAIRLVDKACSENSGAWLEQWGDWGFVLGESDGERHETVLLAVDGSEIGRFGDNSADTWLVAGHAGGMLWTDDPPGPGRSSFVLSPDGQSRIPVPGLAQGEWLDGARWSPDGTRLALFLRASANISDGAVVRIVDVPTAATVAEITESDWGMGIQAWSTDSRFLVYERWLCGDGCGFLAPEGRELVFYDTLTDTTTAISLPTSADGGWGGSVRLADPATPAELVAHYPLDSDATDVSGYGHDGTVVGATPTGDRFGSSDSAYLFDGEDDRITIDMAPQLRTETVSIAAWVKRVDANPPGGGWRVVVSYGEQGHVLSFQHALAPLGGLKMTGSCEFSATQPVLDDDWHHLAMTRSLDGKIRVYLDGEPQPLVPGDDLPSSAEPNIAPTCTVAPAFDDRVWIGGDPGHSEYFHGSVDDVHIYSGTLTDGEIAALATDTP